MPTPSHPHGCHCSLHASIEARRHDCYRQLANAILGADAPHDDIGLAQALAEHARSFQPAANNITQIRPQRVA